MAETIRRLDSALLDDGNRFVHFFEGRVLTGRDLRDQQAADQNARELLGRALGAGVVQGLLVSLVGDTAIPPVVTVSPGLAVNRDGEALALEHPLNLELTRTLTEADSGAAELFGACLDAAGAPPTTDELATVTSGHGFYVLTIMPASGWEEEAPRTGLGDGGVAAGCGRRYNTRGVKFLLHRFEVTAFHDLAADVASDIGALLDTTADDALSKLRNLVAHACLGAVERRFPADPFAGDLDAYGIFDHPLGQAANLQSCEVPLALLHWNAAGVQFVDTWSVRRRSLALPQHEDWPLLIAERRRAEDEARWLQFQEQIASLAARPGGLAGIQAATVLRFIPAVGLLPSTTAAANQFLAGAANLSGPLAIPGAQLIDTLRQGRAYPYLDLAANPGIRLVTALEHAGQSPAVLYQSVEIPSLPFLRNEWEQKCAALEQRLTALESVVDGLDDPATLQGTVTARYFAGIGKYAFPLQDAPVKITRASDGAELVVKTNEVGAYIAPNLIPGTYTVGIDAPAPYDDFLTTLQLQPGEYRVLNVSLSQSNNPGGIAGSIRETQKDVPIKLLDAEGNVVAETTTDEQGKYRFDGVAPGTYQVREADLDVSEKVAVNAGTIVTATRKIRS